jgi:hypothetical protein
MEIRTGGSMSTIGDLAAFEESLDPVLKSVSRWLADIDEEIPAAVLKRGPLATISWLVGPPLSTPTTVLPRF